MRESQFDKPPHRGLGGMIGFGHRIEHPPYILILGAERGPKERENHIAGNVGELFDESGEIHGVMCSLPEPMSERRSLVGGRSSRKRKPKRSRFVCHLFGSGLRIIAKIDEKT